MTDLGGILWGMELDFGRLTDGELIAVIDAAVSALGDDRVRLAAPAERLQLLADAVRLDARLSAWRSALAAEIERGEIAVAEHGTSTVTWLADVVRLTRRGAGRMVIEGQRLARFPMVAEAAGRGEVLPEQVQAITQVLDDLPTDFDADQLRQAQGLMVGFAGTHNASDLRSLSRYLVEVLDPDTADAREAARLERELRAAKHNRHLIFDHDHHGSVRIRGSLPVVDAEAFIRLVDSYDAQAARGIDRLDPLAETITPAMRRADALMALVNAHQQQSLAPNHGGDRPRVVVTVSYDTLVKTATDAGLLHGELGGTGEQVAPSVLRQLLCDAEVMPAVLGADSQVLDVGRTQRLVTPAIRAALEVRDAGCVFPGCDKPPNACHAHHIVPWWAGGVTALHNLVLVCPHHHGVVEPGHNPHADRWKVHVPKDGPAQVIPPRRVDPMQRPRIHTRFTAPMRT